MMVRKLIMTMMIVAFAASLSACGRKNDTIPPEGADPKYPRDYPAPTSPANQKK